MAKTSELSPGLDERSALRRLAHERPPASCPALFQRAVGLYYPPSSFGRLGGPIRMARYAKTKRFSGRHGLRWGNLIRVAALGLALGAGTVGCRTTNDDIERWTTTAQGPRKLVSVLTHSKYPLDLRVEAAMGLVRMKPRGGRRIGIQGQDDQPGLVATLEALPPADRDKIVSRMVPKLEEEMRKEPPKAQAGQAAADPSFPFKDAAFALLTQADGALVQSDENRKRLRAALIEWCMTNFAERMEESSQVYGYRAGAAGARRGRALRAFRLNRPERQEDGPHGRLDRRARRPEDQRRREPSIHRGRYGHRVGSLDPAEGADRGRGQQGQQAQPDSRAVQGSARAVPGRGAAPRVRVDEEGGTGRRA